MFNYASGKQTSLDDYLLRGVLMSDLEAEVTHYDFNTPLTDEMLQAAVSKNLADPDFTLQDAKEASHNTRQATQNNTLLNTPQGMQLQESENKKTLRKITKFRNRIKRAIKAGDKKSKEAQATTLDAVQPNCDKSLKRTFVRRQPRTHQGHSNPSQRSHRANTSPGRQTNAALAAITPSRCPAAFPIGQAIPYHRQANGSCSTLRNPEEKTKTRST